MSISTHPVPTRPVGGPEVGRSSGYSAGEVRSQSLLGASGGASLVVLVDDDPVTTKLLHHSISLSGHRVRAFDSIDQLLRELSGLNPDVIFLDTELARQSVLDAIPMIKRVHRHVPILVHSNEDSVDTAVAAMQAGVFDYIVKPTDTGTIVNAITNAAIKGRAAAQIADLEHHLESRGRGTYAGYSATMRLLLAGVEQAGADSKPVVVVGSDPNSRGLVAKAAHGCSMKHSEPIYHFDANNPTHTAQLIELCDRAVMSGTASEGTIYVESIDNLGPDAQQALTRILVACHDAAGGGRYTPVGPRWIVGTSQPLGQLARQGRFLESLYRELTTHCLTLPKETVRESAGANLAQPTTNGDLQAVAETPMTMDDLERYAIEAALRRTRGNVTRAMRQLGIGRTTLYRKLKKYGIK